MPALRSPSTKIKVVPKDGELEITLNIHITMDGQLTAQSAQAESVKIVNEKDEDQVDMMIPKFSSGKKIDFGGKE